MSLAQNLRSLIPLIIGLAVGGAGVAMFRESMPGAAGTADLRHGRGKQFPKLNPVSGGEFFERGKAKPHFLSALYRLVILVAHPGQLSEALLGQVVRLPQSAEAAQ